MAAHGARRSRSSSPVTRPHPFWVWTARARSAHPPEASDGRRGSEPTRGAADRRCTAPMTLQATVEARWILFDNGPRLLVADNPAIENADRIIVEAWVNTGELACPGGRLP
jgi:hypothetical protein